MSSLSIKGLVSGLTKGYNKKIISPVWFYDEVGSKIFEEIMELPEYYIPKKELEIIHKFIQQIGFDNQLSDLFNDDFQILELGGWKWLKNYKINLRITRKC
jgi:uncharacterized SAM-dependent methyltransferase